MSRKTPFILVDVFTSRPFGGNQLAVFTDAAALSASEMQELAHEMNFSESTFVMPPESSGARRVRIFTPTREMPMAGHPTVGTAWVLASRGEIALESASVDATLQSRNRAGDGDGREHRRQAGLCLDGASRGGVRREAHDRERFAEALGIAAADIRDDLPIQVVSTGFPFIFVPLRTIDALAKMRSQRGRDRRLCSNRASSRLSYICSS